MEFVVADRDEAPGRWVQTEISSRSHTFIGETEDQQEEEKQERDAKVSLPWDQHTAKIIQCCIKYKDVFK